MTAINMYRGQTLIPLFCGVVGTPLDQQSTITQLVYKLWSEHSAVNKGSPTDWPSVVATDSPTTHVISELEQTYTGSRISLMSYCGYTSNGMLGHIVYTQSSCDHGGGLAILTDTLCNDGHTGLVWLQTIGYWSINCLIVNREFKTLCE